MSLTNEPWKLESSDTQRECLLLVGQLLSHFMLRNESCCSAFFPD